MAIDNRSEMRWPWQQKPLYAPDGTLTLYGQISREQVSLLRNFGIAVAWYLKSRDIDQNELAGRMGVSPDRLRASLRGEDLMALTAIAAAAGARVKVSLEDLPDEW